MAELIAATTASATSADITLASGETAVFSVIGSHIGDAIEIRKKDSADAYWLMAEEGEVGSIRSALLTNTIRVRSISNNSSSSMTLQVFKPTSGVASGVDQD